MGSHLSRHEKHGLVYRVDYTDPEWATRAHDRYGPVQPPSRFVFFHDDEGDLSIVSGFAFDGGPLPGCDYDLEPEYIEEPSPRADPEGETAAEPDQTMIDESLLVLTLDGMQDDLRIVSSLFSHHEQFGTVYRVDHVFGDPPTTDRPFRRVFWREPDGTLRSRIDVAMNPLPTL